jgi:hypothetical protein
MSSETKVTTATTATTASVSLSPSSNDEKYYLDIGDLNSRLGPIMEALKDNIDKVEKKFELITGNSATEITTLKENNKKLVGLLNNYDAYFKQFEAMNKKLEELAKDGDKKARKYNKYKSKYLNLKNQ